MTPTLRDLLAEAIKLESQGVARDEIARRVATLGADAGFGSATLTSPDARVNVEFDHGGVVWCDGSEWHSREPRPHQ
jgi:hypothetical protein